MIFGSKCSKNVWGSLTARRGEFEFLGRKAMEVELWEKWRKGKETEEAKR